MAKKFKGIRSFTAYESSAIGAGLSNMLKLTASGMSGTVFAFGDAVEAGDTDYKDVDYVCSIKALDGNLVLDARSLIGDDLSKDGSYNGAIHLTNITLTNGTEVVGAFDKIFIRTGDALVKVAKRI